MATKIMIDPGHGGYDNGAQYNGRKEKDDVLRLALAVGNILKSYGYDVEYTRTTDVYDSPVRKAQIGNESGANYFVSLHRNSSETPGQYNGVQTLIYNDSGIKKEMAENVNKELEKVGYRNINVETRPDLAVLRRTKMPAILVEAGFINSDIDNKLFDEKFNETARAIADGINQTITNATATTMEYDYNPNSVQGYYDMYAERFNRNIMPEGDDGTNEEDGSIVYREPTNNDTVIRNTPKGTVYQVLTGIYNNFGAAKYQMNQLINAGYESEIYEQGGYYQVRVGMFDNIEDAIIAERILRDSGYNTLIVTKNY